MSAGKIFILELVNILLERQSSAQEESQNSFISNERDAARQCAQHECQSVDVATFTRPSSQGLDMH